MYERHNNQIFTIPSFVGKKPLYALERSPNFEYL